MIKISEQCTGCMACVNVCPAKAIRQTRNSYGFIMPEIDKDRCIGCGQCGEVCPIAKKDGKDHRGATGAWCGGVSCQEEQQPLKAYSMFHRSADVVLRSSSGGAFYALSSRVLEEGGIVFGCCYDVKEKKAYLADTDHVALEALLTSKYVESYIGYGFRRLKKQLDFGRKVLFCGTPCQAAGLVYFLRKPYDNLLLVDFTCGAVSAQTCLRRYLVKLEKRFASKIIGVSFRDKHYGWGQYCFTVNFANGRVYRKTAMSDPYFFCFLRSSMQRLSCHGCGFSHYHFSDIILSDFWKCDSFAVERNERRGLSLVLAMTEKGEQALEEIGAMVHREELDVKEASYNLKRRSFSEGKLAEIYAHQACAAQKGVEVLRRRLLSPRKRLYFAFRQLIMDHPQLSFALPGGRRLTVDLARCFPGIPGNGQIMKE